MGKARKEFVLNLLLVSFFIINFLFIQLIDNLVLVFCPFLAGGLHNKWAKGSASSSVPPCENHDDSKRAGRSVEEKCGRALSSSVMTSKFTNRWNKEKLEHYFPRLDLPYLCAPIPGHLLLVPSSLDTGPGGSLVCPGSRFSGTIQDSIC